MNEALEKYFKEVTTVCVLLTDISLPIVNFRNEDIVFTDYDSFFLCIEKILSTFEQPDEI